ncbi:hypothetical protein KC19_6G193100 [Ceratodon purpureus]|uniref:Uncharacterized protein n=1 Tax=Ceratodon purpureus TaxID=3225 RepID=A0A8T0HJA1_CERPU|nr:hypothetical protein KC19_6G193100 [Ceratodon purpureus]
MITILLCLGLLYCNQNPIMIGHPLDWCRNCCHSLWRMWRCPCLLCQTASL